MPRSGGGRSGGARPASRPSAPSGQSRGYSTTAPTAPAAHAPPAHAGAGAIPQRQPGLLAQAASTMGGAVAGSVVGHGISNMLFGGRPVDRAEAPPPEQYAQQLREQGGGCDIPAKEFTKCLEGTGNDMSACSYYLDALKACQAAAKPY